MSLDLSGMPAARRRIYEAGIAAQAGAPRQAQPRSAEVAATPRDRVRGIITAVADKHGLQVAALVNGRGRQGRIGPARRAAMVRLRAETRLSLRQIAAALGLSSHKAVMYGLRRHAERLARAPGAGGRA